MKTALSGEATWSENLHLVMERNGYPEDTWYTFSYSPVRDESGAVAGMFCAGTETTQAVLAEATLRESEEKFSALFAASPAPFLILKPNAPRFTITEVNDAYLAATMRTREEVVGRGVFEAFPDNPDDATIAGVSILRASFERVLASRKPDTLPALKYDVARPDGTFETRWWRPVNSPVLGANGEVEAIIHNATDVTAEHRADVALRESENAVGRARDYAEATLRTSPVPLLVLESDLTVVTANDAFYERFEVDPTQTEGRLVYELGNGQWDIPKLRELLEDILPRHSAFDEFEVTHRFEHIGRRTMLLNGRRMAVEVGGRERIVLVIEDITQRKVAEDALRASDERQAFLLKLGDALRAKPDENAVVDVAVRMLAEEMRLDRCYATAMYPAENRVDVIQEFRRPDLAPMPSPLRFSDFPEAGRRSFDRTLIFDDTANDPELTDTDKSSLAAMNFGAFLSSPVRRGAGNPIWALGAVSSQPRRWTPGEVALMEDTAERTWAAVERARAEVTLRDSESRYRHIVESAKEYAIVTLDDVGCIISWNSGAERLLGYSEEEAIGRSGEIFFTAEDRASGEPEKELSRASAYGRATNERWHVRQDGSCFWGSGVMLPVEDGEEGRYLKIFRDQTEERRADERQTLMIEELNHRVKNTLAVIQSLAQQTFRSAEQSNDAETFEGRLEALARAHDVLTSQHWESADLQEIACATLDSCHGRDSNVTIQGPTVLLPARTTVTVAMALHELCTNAIKYGALSREEGRVSVTWQVTEGASPRLRLCWEESGGPRVQEPKRRGFGTRMIERALAADLGGSATLDYRPQGLVCTIDCPLPGKRLESADAER